MKVKYIKHAAYQMILLLFNYVHNISKSLQALQLCHNVMSLHYTNSYIIINLHSEMLTSFFPKSKKKKISFLWRVSLFFFILNITGPIKTFSTENLQSEQLVNSEDSVTIFDKSNTKIGFNKLISFSTQWQHFKHSNLIRRYIKISLWYYVPPSKLYLR